MAIVGKHNILETVRIQKAPWWRIYENNNKRTSGNYIDSADFKDDHLTIENSLETLRQALERLSTGSYVLVAFNSKDKTKGGIDTMIEIEGMRSMAGPSISGLGTPGAFVVAGIGEITAENFETVLEAKFKEMHEKARKEQELVNLKAEVLSLKKQVEENESGFNKGVMGIGSVIYDIVKSTPSGKEFIGLAAKAMLGVKQVSGSEGSSAVSGPSSPSGDGGDDENRVTTALERLAANNPDFIGQLEKLADLKDNDPNTFESAVSILG